MGQSAGIAEHYADFNASVWALLNIIKVVREHTDSQITQPLKNEFIIYRLTFLLRRLPWSVQEEGTSTTMKTLTRTTTISENIWLLLT